MIFAKITDGLLIRIPNNNQHKTPAAITTYIARESPSETFDFQILYACGRKAQVVKKAARKPTYSGLNISKQYLLFY